MRHMQEARPKRSRRHRLVRGAVLRNEKSPAHAPRGKRTDGAVYRGIAVIREARVPRATPALSVTTTQCGGLVELRCGAMEIPEPEGPPFIGPDDDDPCGICPSRRYPRKQFLVYDRPTREAPFNPADGCRYTADGVPVCVHPNRVGLEPDRMAPPPASEPSAEEPSRTRRRWSLPFLGR